MNKKIVILSRVSTGVQNISGQTKELQDAAIRLGYPIEQQILVENIESAIKLSEEERVGLQQLKMYIENDEDVDCVICWEPSRLARRQAVLYSIRDYLVERKIQLYVLNPYMRLLNDDRTQIDTTASIVFSLFATISENEMNIKKERFKRARQEMTKQGKKSGGATIFGYVKNKDKYMELHPIHSRIVSEIFNYYIDNEEASLHSTYMWLSSKYPELFPILPYKKAQRKTKHFFETPVYWEGNWCYPNIITNELHEKVMKKMSNARCQARFETKNNFLGRGRIYCKHCGKRMIGVGGTTHAYYCTTDKLHNMTLNLDAIDWLLWEEAKVIANIKSTTDHTNTIMMTRKSIEEKTNLKKQYESKLKELEERQNKLLTVYLDGNINKEIFDRQNGMIVEEVKMNKVLMQRLDAEIIELETLLNNVQDVVNVKAINYDEVDNFDTKLEIVRNTISKVWIEKKEKKHYSIEFEYNGVIVPQKGRYMYTARNQYKRIWRINEDETVDLIYEGVKPQNKDLKTGRFK